VLATAKAEGWAQPDLVQDWMQRITISGDARLRVQSSFLDKGNLPGALLDVAAFNAQGPFDINLATNPSAFPTLNSTENRAGRLLLRARLGLEARPTDWAKVGLRIATGTNDSPVSTNTLLGTNFTKRGIWLDRGYIELKPVKEAAITLGRMPNPFDVTEMLFDRDLNFEGVAVAGKFDGVFDPGLSFSATAGAFPLEFTPIDFPNNSDVKGEDRNKWLLGGQLGSRFAFSERGSAGFSAGYFEFQNIQGLQSEPCATFLQARQCSTDPSRPTFVQKGNTVFPIRLIAQNSADPNFVITPIPQFLGLAFDYNLLYLKADAKFGISDRYVGAIGADFVRNLGYRKSDACRFGAGASPFTNVELGFTAGGQAIGNLCAPVASGDTAPRLLGGDTGWHVYGSVGSPKITKLWDWTFGAGYRYLESDAVPDGFTDSNFGFGGTNVQGYYMVGTLGLDRFVNIQTRWLSTREISGPAYAIDVFLVDFNVNF
ncbi:MAG: putative porin, partial [Sandaracinobacteroides sp.]